ncbi:50S ribosomal protein L28 [bacterium]|nr:50S ribosomal protein L28 [bacterium]
MAKVCDLCGKQPTVGKKYKKLMSRYNPSKTRQHPNLQKATLPSGKTIRVCAKCKKSLHKLIK